MPQILYLQMQVHQDCQKDYFLLQNKNKYFLYSIFIHKKLALKRILPIHKNIFKQIQDGQVQINEIKNQIQEQVKNYPKENKLIMDQKVMDKCVSLYDIYLGINSTNNQQKKKTNSKQKSIMKRLQQIKKTKQQQEKIAQEKKKQYQIKIKQWQKNKQLLELKKKAEQQKRQKMIMQEQEKIKKQKQLKAFQQKQEKRKKVQEGVKQIQQRRKKRLEMIRQKSLQKIQKLRSSSMKTFEKLPRYIQLQKKYLQKQRQKMKQAQKQRKLKRQSMIVRLQDIKQHQKQYIQRIKQKLSPKKQKQNHQVSENHENNSATTLSRKVKSDFSLLLGRNQIEDNKNRQKQNRRKQFQNKVRNIPINIDPIKKKEKQIEVDKLTNKQKYQLLANKKLNDDQIFDQFKDFQIKINRKQLGNNYLNQVRILSKSIGQKVKKNNSHSLLQSKTDRMIYKNYLQDLRHQDSPIKKSISKIAQNDELLQLIQRSRKFIKKNIHQEQQIYKLQQSNVSLNSKQPNYRTQLKYVQMQRKNQQKAEVTKTITQKIAQYQQKVYKKVNDLKKISQYDDTLKQQKQIDDLYAKVLKGKVATLQLN